MKFYVASKLDNASNVRALIEELERRGGECTYDWTQHGSVRKSSLSEIQSVAMAEVQGVLDADVVVVLLPGGRGTHVELGLALSNPDRIVLVYSSSGNLFLGDDMCLFYQHPRVIRLSGHWDATMIAGCVLGAG